MTIRNREVFPPISQEHAAAIGRVVAHWALVEGAERSLIPNLLRLGPEARDAVTAHLSAMQRADMIHSLIHATREQEWLDEWDVIAVEIKRLRDARNKAAHAEWHVVGGEHFVRSVKSRGKVTYQFGPLKTDELLKSADEMLTLCDRIIVFGNQVLRAADILSQWNPEPPLVADASERRQLKLVIAKSR